ncbi:MAG: hypothetical protein K0S74_849 [Chlamydiales bacterium]|jgi:phosphatidylserine/phosphatidylglycerophosphate/cardiolipin synthase-like enzyme|nr:hypothetical protein [Chlamydiales bacterium]
MLKNLKSLYRALHPKVTFNLILGLIALLFLSLSLEAALPKLPQPNTPILFYSNKTRQDLRLTLDKALAKAKESITIVVYTLSDYKIIKTLNTRAKSGVKVQVIYDAKAFPQVKSRLSPNVKIYPFSKDGLMHQKIIIIDHSQIWIGTANFTTASLRYHGNLVLGIDHPNLAQAFEQYLSPMLQQKQPTKAISPQDFIVGGQRLEVWTLPQHQEAEKRVLELIQSSKNSIQIHMFTWTRTDFAEAVISAHKRGVKVQVVLDADAAKGASFKIVKMLRKAKVPVNISKGTGLFHYKAMIVDQEVLVVGSANWTKAAFSKNNDLFLVLHDLTAEQIHFLNHLAKVSVAESARAA